MKNLLWIIDYLHLFILPDFAKASPPHLGSRGPPEEARGLSPNSELAKEREESDLWRWTFFCKLTIWNHWNLLYFLFKLKKSFQSIHQIFFKFNESLHSWSLCFPALWQTQVWKLISDHPRLEAWLQEIITWLWFHLIMSHSPCTKRTENVNDFEDSLTFSNNLTNLKKAFSLVLPPSAQSPPRVDAKSTRPHKRRRICCSSESSARAPRCLCELCEVWEQVFSRLRVRKWFLKKELTV